MTGPYSIRNSRKVALLLVAVFILFLAKNHYDQNKITELETSFMAVYEDRLIAESYIYRLSEHLYQKKILLDARDTGFATDKIEALQSQTAAINTILHEYEVTKLTEKEALVFEELKRNLENINSFELAYTQHAGTQDASTKLLLDDYFGKVSGNLHLLSGIQLAEGKILSEKSKKTVAISALLKYLEIALLVAAGLLIHSILLLPNTSKSSLLHDISLN